jgi:methionyl-tRNA formyltransferase
MRIVFMGTPEFAAKILEHLTAWPGGRVEAVYTRPDRAAGRGRKTMPGAVKTAALAGGIPVFQPDGFRDAAAVSELGALAADVLVVAAYGLILPQRVLDLPRLGAYNVHASLLPRHRGAAPVQRAVMNGDAVTGVTVMKMEAGLDTGPILLQRALAVREDDTAGTLLDLLADLGGRLMTVALDMLKEGRAALVPQNGALASHAPKISPLEEWIPWNLPAGSVHNHIRGLTPSPGARSLWIAPGREPLPVRIDPGAAAEGEAGFAPGTVFACDGQDLLVACAAGRYRVRSLRPAGRNAMSASAFRNGYLRGMAPPYGMLAGPALPGAPAGARG